MREVIGSRLALLTPQQRRVLACIADGADNKTICCALGVTNATVKTHVHAMMRTMRASSRTEAASMYLHHWQTGGSMNRNFIAAEAVGMLAGLLTRRQLQGRDAAQAREIVRRYDESFAADQAKQAEVRELTQERRERAA